MGMKTYVSDMPISLDCAGYIANLNCFTYELVFLRCKFDTGNDALAKQLLRFPQYIEYLLCDGILTFLFCTIPTLSLELNMTLLSLPTGLLICEAPTCTTADAVELLQGVATEEHACTCRCWGGLPNDA